MFIVLFVSYDNNIKILQYLLLLLSFPTSLDFSFPTHGSLLPTLRATLPRRFLLFLEVSNYCLNAVSNVYSSVI